MHIADEEPGRRSLALTVFVAVARDDERVVGVDSADEDQQAHEDVTYGQVFSSDRVICSETLSNAGSFGELKWRSTIMPTPATARQHPPMK